jgi:uncharacterized protein YndB with AHSA1/START domain
VDGLFYLAMKHEGRTWTHYGRFIRIERPRQVEYTWVSESTQGVETVVAVTFEPRDGQTEVTLRHSRCAGRRNRAAAQGRLGLAVIDAGTALRKTPSGIKPARRVFYN